MDYSSEGMPFFNTCILKDKIFLPSGFLWMFLHTWKQTEHLNSQAISEPHTNKKAEQSWTTFYNKPSKYNLQYFHRFHFDLQLY